MYCPSCGVNNRDEVKFCTRCGTNLDVVSDALSGKSTGSLETDDRMVRLLKDYYRSRRMTIIGGIASLIALFKLALLLALGFPEKMIPLAALAAGLLIYGLFALIWGMTKWNNSSSEIKALGFSPPKGKKLAPAPNQLRLGADPASIRAPAYATDPIASQSSVTEHTTRLLDEGDQTPPTQPIRGESGDAKMTEIPEARTKRTSYENFAAQCPWCGVENVFNRASDLKSFEPIGHRTINCLNTTCLKAFNIGGDSVNSAYEMLVFDCHELLEQKHYMNCILTLVQAYEVFFNIYFRVELLYKPFAADEDDDIEKLNHLSMALADKTESFAFGPMRKRFLQHITTHLPVKTLAEADAAIAELANQPREPSDSQLESLGDSKLITLLKGVKATNINTLRDRVVHKGAYRPTGAEAEAALEQTRSVLLPLGAYLKLYDEINWYKGKLTL